MSGAWPHLRRGESIVVCCSHAAHISSWRQLMAMERDPSKGVASSWTDVYYFYINNRLADIVGGPSAGESASGGSRRGGSGSGAAAAAGGGGGGSGGAAAAGGGGGPMLALAKSPSKHRTLKGGDAKGAAAGGGGEEEDLLEGGDTWRARGLLWPQLILLFRPRGADNKIVRLTQQPPNIMGGQVRAGGGSARARPA